MREIHIEKIFKYLLVGLPYLRITVAYVAASLVFGFLIGIIIAKLNMSKIKIAKLSAQTYITLTRCTPPLVLLSWLPLKSLYFQLLTNTRIELIISIIFI